MYFATGLKPQPWRPKRHALRAVGAKHLGGSKGREVLSKGREVLSKGREVLSKGREVLVRFSLYI